MWLQLILKIYLHNIDIYTIPCQTVYQVVVWAIDQKQTKELEAEMQRIKIPFRLKEEPGMDGKGKIQKWSQPQGEYN